MGMNSKRDRLLLMLAAIFITSAITAELISSKVFLVDLGFGTYAAVVGILPWPVVFLTTDIINEFYGRKVVRRLSIITVVMICYAFLLVFAAMQFNTILDSPTDKEYSAVFGQSLWIITGSIIAFMTTQLLDSFLFWYVRERTGKGFIWLRSTGSTVVSQLIDSFIVLYIGFYLPGKLPPEADFFSTGMTNYVIKLLIAVGLTPLIYLFHYLVDKYLGEENSDRQIRQTAEESLHHKVDE
ncbi:MAG: hypothetical protein FD123_2189 [Bacteroidetes bacterium]|nr:MAG: hypothetical protein FD123_2189 [Bacteroidota bacterium]